MCDGKASTVLVYNDRWLAVDSHARSVSGKVSPTSSLSVCGLMGVRWRHTLGEVMLRGGVDAAYKEDHSAAFWILAPNVATSCDVPMFA